MAVQPQYLAWILEQLAGVEQVTTRRMFGGVGLYSRGLFFGLIDDDTLFFKTDESNAAEYQARNMPRFMPPADRPLGPMGYHQVPADIIEDAEMLVVWARRAVAVALASHAVKARPKSRPKARGRLPAKRTARAGKSRKKLVRRKPAAARKPK